MFGKQFLGNKKTCMMRYCHIPTYYLFILVSSDIISTFTGVIVVVCFSSFVVISIPLLHAVMINIYIFIYYTILSSFVFEFLLVCHVCCSVMCVVMITECHPIFNITFIITLKSREDGCSIQGMSFNHLSPYRTTTSHISRVLNIGLYIDTHFFLLGHSMAIQFRDLFQKKIANFPTSQNFPNSYFLRIQAPPRIGLRVPIPSLE